METTRKGSETNLKPYFLSYLWGMETYYYSKFSTNLIKSFLSYLWGMETDKIIGGIKDYFAFYPTYEEWKQKYK